MFRQEKETFVQQMQAELDKAQAALLVDFTGLTVAEADAFRGKIREANLKYEVVKNTLTARAVEGKSYEGIRDVLKGTPTGIVLGFEDPISPAKVTYAFLKECGHLRVKGGIFEERAISAEEAEALAKLPSREELIGEVVGLAMSPASNFLAQIKSPSGRIVGALETKSEESAA